jgi:hypothetical protein
MPTPQLKFRAGFWTGVAWGAPDSPRRALCSKCHGPLEEVPLMLWSDAGAMIQLCDACVERWVTSE